MKKRFVTLLSLLACASLLLASCAKLPKMEYENGVYTNAKTGIRYTAAPAYYEAIALEGEEAVARVMQKDNELLMYQMKGVAPEKMLASANYEVFCAVGTKLPELGEMDVERVLVCQTAGKTYELATLSSERDIAELVGAYCNFAGFDANEIDVGLQKERYDLKFSSKTVPGVYYCLTYWEFADEVLVYEVIDDFESFEKTYPDVEVTTEEYKGEKYAVYHFGTNILYNRATGLCYPAGDIVAKYLQGEADTQ